jgi:hypothetical protein
MNSNQVTLRDQTPQNPQLDFFTSLANHGGALGRLGLGIAKEVTDFAFETAKLSTRIGLGISKTIVDGVGMNSQILDVAEFFAILGIEIGHGITSFSLQGSTEIVKIVQECFGDKHTIEMAVEFGNLLQREFTLTGRQISYYEMWRCFSAWMVLHKRTNDLWAQEFVHPVVCESKIDKANTQRYLRFANGAYGQQAIHFLKGNRSLVNVVERQFYAQYCDIPVQDVIHISNIDKPKSLLHSEYSPAYCLSIDHVHKEIILAFRGTLSAKDAIVDLACEPISLCLEGETEEFALHGGMLKVVSRLSEPSDASGLYNRLNELMTEHADYGLILTGHSLGAGLASILGVLWADERNGRIKADCGLPDRSISVHAFACPSVMDLKLGKKCQSFIFSYVIGWDWLARISMFNVLEIRDAIIWLKQQDEIEPGLVHSLLESGVSSTGTAEDLYAIRQRIIKFHSEESKHSMKLFPPGNITWMYESKSYSVQDRQSVFGELVFTQNNFNHHLPLVYEEFLETL